MTAKKIPAKAPPKYKRQLVIVIWEDAFAAAVEKWTAIEDIDIQPRVIETMGYEIIGLMEGHVVVVQSWDEAAETVASAMIIPAGMVKSKQLIK